MFGRPNEAKFNIGVFPLSFEPIWYKVPNGIRFFVYIYLILYCIKIQISNTEIQGQGNV